MERDVITSKKINFAGVFDPQGLYDVMKSWASDKGYAFVELSHSESLKSEGKFIEVILYPVFKNFSDYAKGVFKIHVQMKKVKDITVKQDDKKLKMKEGTVTISIIVFIETDYEARWESKPIFYVLRTIAHKYFLSPFIDRNETVLRKDLALLESNIKSFLNLQKFRK